MDASGRGLHVIGVSAVNISKLAAITVTSKEACRSLLELPRQLQALQPGGCLVADFCSANSALVYCNRVCSWLRKREKLLGSLSSSSRRVRSAASTRPWWTASARGGCLWRWRV